MFSNASLVIHSLKHSLIKRCPQKAVTLSGSYSTVVCHTSTDPSDHKFQSYCRGGMEGRRFVQYFSDEKLTDIVSDTDKSLGGKGKRAGELLARV